jgi:Xaa-Pro aminopeptidase
LDRIAKLLALLARRAAGGYVTGVRQHLHYFTGIYDVGGALLVAPGRQPVLCASFYDRYNAMDQAEALGCDVEITHPPDRLVSIAGPIAERIEAWGLRSVLLDGAGRPEGFAEVAPSTAFAMDDHAGFEIRRKKEPGEYAMLRRACSIADAAMGAMFAAIRPGVRETDIVAEGQYAARRLGSEWDAFTFRMTSGPRSAYPDGNATDRIIQRGDMGFIDVGILHYGYLGDFTRSFVVGEPIPRQTEIISAVTNAMLAAQEAAKPGMPARDLHRVCVDALAEAGLAEHFFHHAGHGLGLGVEPPMITPESEDVMAEGDCFTIEPGVYLRGFGGARMENDLILYADGVESMTKFPLDFVLAA